MYPKEVWLVLETWPAGVPCKSHGEFKNHAAAMFHIVELIDKSKLHPNHYLHATRVFKTTNQKGDS